MFRIDLIVHRPDVRPKSLVGRPSERFGGSRPEPSRGRTLILRKIHLYGLAKEIRDDDLAIPQHIGHDSKLIDVPAEIPNQCYIRPSQDE